MIKLHLLRLLGFVESDIVDDPLDPGNIPLSRVDALLNRQQSFELLFESVPSEQIMFSDPLITSHASCTPSTAPNEFCKGPSLFANSDLLQLQVQLQHRYGLIKISLHYAGQYQP